MQIRARYIVGFTMAEAAMTAAGQTFNGYDKTTGITNGLNNNY